MTETPHRAPTLAPPIAEDYPFDDHYPLEDPYAELREEDIAYAVFDWDDLDEATVDRHDAIVTMDRGDLEALDLETLSDLERWAVVRNHARANDTEGYIAVCRRILDTSGDKRSPHLSYPDIALELAMRQARAGHTEQAQLALDACAAEKGHDPIELERATGVIAILSGSFEKGMLLLEGAVAEHELEDPELALHLGDELLALDQPAAAARIYDAGIALANRRGFVDLRAELEDARRACGQ